VLRLSSWARLPPRVTDARGRRDVLRQLDEAVRFVQSAVDEIVADGSSASPQPSRDVWSERTSQRGWAGMDDPLEGMRGHSRAFTIPELLSFVSVCHKTGILRVHTDEENFLVQLEEGMVVYARSDHLERGEHLAEILVANGVVSAEVIEGYERTGPLLPESLARYLGEAGLASADDVNAAIIQQVHFIFGRLSSARDAYFRFYEGARVCTESEVRININKLLIESARRSDEETHREAAPAEAAAAAEEQLVPIEPEELEEFMRGETTAVEVVDDGAAGESPFRSALEQVLESDELDLPLLDAAASELLILCWDEEINVVTLEEHISRDQGLCAHILRVANSAAFAPVVPIASVQLAIARLGMDRIREIALALTVRQKAFVVPGWEHEVRQLWRRAAITSGFAKALCRRTGSTPRRGSLLGLLQDVGMPVVLNTLCEIEAERGVELEDTQARELMQEFHGQVGSLLARQWSLPGWLETVLRCHHLTEELGEASEHRADVLIAHGADHLASWAEDRDPGAVEDLTRRAPFGELGLTPEQVRNILDETDAILACAEIYA